VIGQPGLPGLLSCAGKKAPRYPHKISRYPVIPLSRYPVIPLRGLAGYVRGPDVCEMRRQVAMAADIARLRGKSRAAANIEEPERDEKNGRRRSLATTPVAGFTHWRNFLKKKAPPRTVGRGPATDAICRGVNAAAFGFAGAGVQRWACLNATLNLCSRGSV
jgi:hypothetical protein